MNLIGELPSREPVMSECKESSVSTSMPSSQDDQ